MTNATAATTPSGQPLGISHRPSPTEAMFDAFKASDEPAFIGYLPYGFPNPDYSLKAFKTMVEHGVDAVEIGLPYSDPVMDGPVIQAASQIAIDNGETIANVFKAVETVANAGGVPLVMSYWNLIFHYGVERFARDFENAGGAGLITPDLIPDEAGEWIEASDRHGLDRVFLVSPDSTAFPPPNRGRVSAPMQMASSSVPPWCTPCSTNPARPPSTRRRASRPLQPRPRSLPKASTTPATERHRTRGPRSSHISAARTTIREP